MCILLSLQLFRENANPTLEATEVTASKLSNACKRCKGSNTNKLKIACDALDYYASVTRLMYIWRLREKVYAENKYPNKHEHLCRREAHISELL